MPLTRAEILDIRNLRSRRERERTQTFVVEGLKSVIELHRSPLVCKRVWATAKGIASLPEDLQPIAEVIDANAMSRLSSMKTAPGVLAVAEMPDWTPAKWHAAVANHPMPLVLVADQLNDPGNVGTLIRTADWFDCAGVVLTEGSADAFNAKSVQAAMGSAFRLPILSSPAPAFLAEWTGAVAVLDAGGANLYDFVPPAVLPLALVVGSESHGPASDWGGFDKIAIPHGLPSGRQDQAESLNAAIAASIATAEIARKWRDGLPHVGH